MVDVAVGFGHVAAQIVAGRVAEGALQDERQLRADMGVVRQRAPGPDPQQPRRELLEAGQQPRLGDRPEMAPGDLIEAPT